MKPQLLHHPPLQLPISCSQPSPSLSSYHLPRPPYSNQLSGQAPGSPILVNFAALENGVTSTEERQGSSSLSNPGGTYRKWPHCAIWSYTASWSPGSQPPLTVSRENRLHSFYYLCRGRPPTFAAELLLFPKPGQPSFHSLVASAEKNLPHCSCPSCLPPQWEVITPPLDVQDIEFWFSQCMQTPPTTFYLQRHWSKNAWILKNKDTRGSLWSLPLPGSSLKLLKPCLLALQPLTPIPCHLSKLATWMIPIPSLNPLRQPLLKAVSLAFPLPSITYPHYLLEHTQDSNPAAWLSAFAFMGQICESRTHDWLTPLPPALSTGPGP